MRMTYCTIVIENKLKMLLPNAELAQTFHTIDCFPGSFRYIQTVFCLNWLIAQPSYERGTNNISKFGHHYINGGAIYNR
jgi:hypothetical protein